MTPPGPSPNLGTRGSILVIVVAVLLLRLPFLTSAIQEDDYYYLAGAKHALVEPAHPHHARYIFQGDLIDMRGHPHPPLNAWLLAVLLASFGGVREVPFHVAYMLLYVGVGIAMFFIARRFTPHPLIATLLLIATPVLMVQASSLESDLPFLAFWLAGIACFLRAVDRDSTLLLSASGALLSVSSMGAFQSVLAAPILGVYLWQRRRTWTAAWVIACSPAIVLGCWELFERVTSDALPATVLAGYFRTYGLQQITNKVKNTLALTGHLTWLVFPVLAVAALSTQRRWIWITGLVAAIAGAFIDASPLFWISFGLGAAILAWCISLLRTEEDGDQQFLAAWVVIFFGAALLIFFAGAARYLLPIAAPLVILITRNTRMSKGWLAAGVAGQALLGFAFAAESEQQWNTYRSIAAAYSPLWNGKRLWVNGEWGLRYYLEQQGARPVERERSLRPGDVIVTSELGYPIPITTGGGRLVQLAEADVRSPLPIRLLALNTHSAFSTISFGLRPFDLGTAAIDKVRIEEVIGQKPVLSFLTMNAPEASFQIESGLYSLEGNKWRWSSKRAAVLLANPGKPAALEADLYIPDNSRARHIRLLVDGKPVAEQTYPGPGQYSLRSTPLSVSQTSTEAALEVDQVTRVPGDGRELGVSVTAIGFAP